MTTPPAKLAATRNPLIFFSIAGAAHIILALYMRSNHDLGVYHAVAALLIACWVSMAGPIVNIAYAAAYISGCEVLWRMNQTTVFWEFAKYVTALLLIIALVRSHRLQRPGASVLYFLLLVPSALIPIMNVPFEWARQEVSFNMSGPFVLALGVWFFSGTRMSRDELIRVFFWFLVPLAGIGFLGMDAIASAGDIEFTLNSNYVTSGGYAPNQVSTVLGLASFACFLILVISSTSNVVLKALAFAGMLYFAGHAAVTMSRGGLYGAGAGMLAAGFFFAQSPRARGSLILGALLGGVLVWLLIFPRLNDFTKGKLQQRLERTTTSGRSEIMMMELEMWRENFLLGVGPGKTGPLLRGQLTYRPAPHTEFTRMLGEHGLLGLGALIVLGVISVRMVSRAPSQQARAVTAGLMVWTIMNMMSAAMRLAAPGFFFGLAACLFALETGQPQAGPAPRRR